MSRVVLPYAELTSEQVDLKNFLLKLYVEDKNSIPQVAAIIGIPPSTLQGQMKKLGVAARTKAEGISLRRDVLGLQAKGRKRTMTPEWRNNIRVARLAWSSSNAVGYRVTSNGYCEYTIGEHKGRSVHVVKFEQRIGRKLREDEVVHHIDENKQNNAFDNLALMTRAAHSRLHQIVRSSLRKAETETGRGR